MKTLTTILIFLVVALPAFAQTSHKFSLDGKALGYAGGGSALVAADAAVEIQLTPKLWARQDNIILSTQAPESNLGSFSLGGVEGIIPIKALPKEYTLYGFGEGGVIASGLATTPALSAGAGLEYHPPSTPSVTVNLFEVRWLHGKVPLGNGQVSNNGVGFAVGISFP